MFVYFRDIEETNNKSPLGRKPDRESNLTSLECSAATTRNCSMWEIG